MCIHLEEKMQIKYSVFYFIAKKEKKASTPAVAISYEIMPSCNDL